MNERYRIYSQKEKQHIHTSVQMLCMRRKDDGVYSPKNEMDISKQCTAMCAGKNKISSK